MSDPQPDHLKQTPTRAEPLQPDAPGRGDASEQPAGKDPGAKREGEASSVRRAEEQENTALKNTSEGYD